MKDPFEGLGPESTLKDFIAKLGPSPTLQEVRDAHRAFNIFRAPKVSGLPNPAFPRTLSGRFSLECSVCGKRGPERDTVAQGAMAAQKEGFCYDRTGLRAGNPVKWFCSGCQNTAKREVGA